MVKGWADVGGMLPPARIWLWAAWAALLVLLTAGSHAAQIIKDADCLECHSDKTLNKTNEVGRVISFFVDEVRLRASVHKTNTCQSCHGDITAKHPDDNVVPLPVDCASCHARQTASYGASKHGIALKAGDASAPSCKDCHDAHTVLPSSDPGSPLNFRNVTKTCGACHDSVAAEVRASVHGKGVAEGRSEAATCIDCHFEHQIEQLSTNSTLKISVDVCGKCHASERINTKFNMPQDRVKTFFASYHGLASQYGSTLAANCSSCHGHHLVLPSADPRSTINPSHLVATCGKCHAGATANFAAGKMHVDNDSNAKATDVGGRANAWVRRVYLVLIFGTIGFMLVHNGLLFLRKWIRAHRGERRTVVRMTRHQRWQHFLLAGSFIILAITGFALKFPDSWIAHALGSHEDFRRWTHRIAGVVMLVLGAYHVGYLLFTKSGRQLLRDFLPVKKDVTDFLTNARYLLGNGTAKAQFGRFGYAEKLEYWAVVWGTIIMGVTGLLVWFKIDVTRFLPRWAIEVATTIHYYEAILACLAIIVWHLYHVMFDPDVYPLNLACWDGKVTEHWMEEEHPLAPKAAPPSAPSSPQAGQNRS